MEQVGSIVIMIQQKLLGWVVLILIKVVVGLQVLYPNTMLVFSETLMYETKDIRMDVTGLVKNHIYSSSIYPNNGFIIKREKIYTHHQVDIVSLTQESTTVLTEHDTNQLGQLKFFSRETNTIFPPKLEVEWDDSSWSKKFIGL